MNPGHRNHDPPHPPPTPSAQPSHHPPPTPTHHHHHPPPSPLPHPTITPHCHPMRNLKSRNHERKKTIKNEVVPVPSSQTTDRMVTKIMVGAPGDPLASLECTQGLPWIPGPLDPLSSLRTPSDLRPLNGRRISKMSTTQPNQNSPGQWPMVYQTPSSSPLCNPFWST